MAWEALDNYEKNHLGFRDGSESTATVFGPELNKTKLVQRCYFSEKVHNQISTSFRQRQRLRFLLDVVINDVDPQPPRVVSRPGLRCGWLRFSSVVLHARAFVIECVRSSAWRVRKVALI